jgi:hypothetical protein
LYQSQFRQKIGVVPFQPFGHDSVTDVNHWMC